MITVVDGASLRQSDNEQGAQINFVQLQFSGELVPVNFSADEYPLDRKILGGIALRGRTSAEHIAKVSERLNSAFNQLEQDKSREFGACLAYGIDVPCEDEVWLDEALVQTAVARNHGMLTKEGSSSSLQLWEGHNSDKNFILTKYVGNILLNNYEMPTGLIYSLVGAKRS